MKKYTRHNLVYFIISLGGMAFTGNAIATGELWSRFTKIKYSSDPGLFMAAISVFIVADLFLLVMSLLYDFSKWEDEEKSQDDDDGKTKMPKTKNENEPYKR